MQVVDLFAGMGGASEGARQAGAEVVLAIESDPAIARVYELNHGDHLRVETLGGPVDALARELRARFEPSTLHLHASPPCQRLSSVNQTTRDPAAGLRLIEWYLDLVRVLAPRSYSMEQVPHAAVLHLLHSRGVPFVMVNALDFGVPSSRKRLIAGSVAIVKALERRKGSGPTVLPVHVLPSLRPAARYHLCSATCNQPVKVRRNGVRVTTGHRPMEPGEGGRDLHRPAHAVWGKPGRVYDRESKQIWRKLTPAESSVLQGFPPGYTLCDRSAARSQQIVGNAFCPPLAKAVFEAAMAP